MENCLLDGNFIDVFKKKINLVFFVFLFLYLEVKIFNEMMD